MVTNRCLCALAVVIALALVQVPQVAFTEEPGILIQSDPGWAGIDGSDYRPYALEEVQNISMSVKVPPGKSFYIGFDEKSRTLKVMRQPDSLAGLPPEAVSAVQRSPAWIQEDLAKMLGRLSETPIKPSTIEDYSAPVFADMDGDGDEDIVLGDTSGTLTLYENVDPALHYYEMHDNYVSAVYVKRDTFFPASLRPGVSGYSHPAVGDLNGDNLLDVVIGGGDGRVYVFENNGPAGSPTWNPKGIITTIDALGFADPALGDVDGDGDLDVMVGSGSGWLHFAYNFCSNPGAISDGDPSTVTTAMWSSSILVDLGITSYSSPAFADMDGDGKLDMVVGEGGGWVNLYRFVSGNWQRDASVFPGVSTDSRATPALIDMDDDGLVDLLAGSREGYLRHYANVGNSTSPRFFLWQSYATNFDNINFNQYYSDANHVYLVHRGATQRLLDYSNIIMSAPQEMVDEIAFSIARANAASLLHPSTFPEVYLNNTESLYFNSQFTTYAEILDYGLGTPDQWSTVRYVINESGVDTWYEYPRDIYYWWLVSLKGTDEMATFINPALMFAGHEGARNQSAGGVFWRWAAFNMASPSWPADPPGRGYPKEELPPVLRDKIPNATVMWNNQTYSMGAIYNADGTFKRDAFGNISRPWNATNQAVEIVAHWVSSNLPLNAQAGADANRPRQPVRIQWEHNGNCGEISDLLWAGLRAAMIPARGLCGYGGDHCWGEFYDRGWHQIDDYWDASTSIIANNDNYHYGWNRDWSGLMAVRGDGLNINLVDNYHKTWDASDDSRYPPESEGLIDRANVTVVVTDADGHPLDGVKVAIGDYRYFMSTWTSFGTQWTFTDADGKARFSTSEARQNWNLTNPDAGDSFDDGIGIFVISKVGTLSLGESYAERLKPSYGDAYNPRNAPMHYYNFTLADRHPRPSLPVTEVPLPPSGLYTLDVDFSVTGAVQHPAVAVRWNEGLAFHDYEMDTGMRVTSFIASGTELSKQVSWDAFSASNVSHGTPGETLSFGIPASGDWYFVISNPGTLETVQVVDFTARLLRPEPEQRTFTITSQMLGKRLMSLPFRPVDTDIDAVLSSVWGSFDYVRWFDPNDAADHWKSYTLGRSYNSLLHLDETMGFWINFTVPCTWTLTGYPAENTAMRMRTGWNLLGYPSNSTTYTVADLKADIGVPGVRVEGLDTSAAMYNLRVLPDAYALRAGEGYWVLVPQDCIWTVAW